MSDNVANLGGGEQSHPMEFLLAEELNLPTNGETRQGWVIEHRNNAILIDIGAKSEGVISGSELQNMDDDTRELLAVGNEVTVYIVNTEDQHGNVIVSYAKAAEELDWTRAEALMDSQDIFKGKVIGQNKGGLLVKLGQLRGFIPNSQISRRRNFDDNQKGKITNNVIQTKVIEVDRKRGRLILSERAAEKEARQAKRAELLANLEEGSVLSGRVINLAAFGAFIDVGGVEGLVHLSELSWKRVNAPADILEVGDQVEVYVLNIDQDRERLALSLKRLEPDPWTIIDEYYQEGQLLEATITKLTKYGAFARLDDEYALEGLIHISELSENHVNHPRDVVQPSQTVTVRIIRVDKDQRQLGLSIKQVVSDKFVEADLEKLTTIQE
ncbi:MAG: S1 RNA-binding domain-containing protein [Ardenticatenaceae bacterium]|nr:S1 RNA-binding domain-containing protein [Anaerolineales bacterium]MCB9008416.1 S1 RNA-binding domain-containing protein [Ardenticatenaceae bacterium]